MEVTVANPACVVTVAPVVSTSPAYTSGDAVGGLQTIANAVRTSGRVSLQTAGCFDAGTAVLQSVTVVENGSQKAALSIVLFSTNPSATTVTDNGALTINTADIAKIVGIVNIAAADYTTVGGASVASKIVSLQLPVAADTVTLYAIANTTSTPTYTLTSSLKFIYGFLQN